MTHLRHGDHLQGLRYSSASDSVDLMDLDSPFPSQATSKGGGRVGRAPAALSIHRKLKELSDGKTLRLGEDDNTYLQRTIQTMRRGAIEEFIPRFGDDGLNPTDITDEQVDAALKAQTSSPRPNRKVNTRPVVTR